MYLTSYSVSDGESLSSVPEGLSGGMSCPCELYREAGNRVVSAWTRLFAFSN